METKKSKFYIDKIKKNPTKALIRLLDDEDFRDNFVGRELEKYIKKYFIIKVNDK